MTISLDDERAYWLGFSLIPGIARYRMEQLYQRFGSLATAWRADRGDLLHYGFDHAFCDKLLPRRASVNLPAELEKLQRVRARLVTLIDEEYPPLLRTLSDAPPVLYVRGALLPADQRALAIVGTRKATAYGEKATETLTRALVAQQVTIVSGLAQGIDTKAHSACLSAGGRTLAVLGCGIHQIYPRENDRLARQIMESGAILSEFRIGTPPDGRNFPRRNRVISGLSLGVLIPEAPLSSGALITATYAAEQGRDVFAVPSSIFSPAGEGANRLIQDGAKLVMTAEDILNELNLAHAHVETAHQAERIQPANETEALLLSHLSAEPIHVDEITRQTGLPVAVITSTLTILELKGLAQMVGHMQYSRVYHQ